MLNLITYFKFLSRNKFYSFVTIFGFALSLMFVFLIAAYVTQELSVDKFHEKGGRIYIVASEESVGGAYRLAERLADRYPEIEAAVPMATELSNQPVAVNNDKFQAKTTFAEKNFFDVFSFPLSAGDRGEVLASRNNAVVSESFARKVFSGKDPLGQTIQYNDSVTVTVTGVMKDIRQSAIPYADIIIRMDNVKYFNALMDDPNFSNAGGAVIALLAKEGTDIRAKTDDMASFLKEIFWIYQRGIVEKVQLIPLREFYFYEIESNGLLEQGNKSFVLVLMTVGFIILLFAVFNYINLTVAQTSFRAKEMAIRSLVGADPKESFRRLSFESILLTFISLLIGIGFAFLLVPYVNNLLGTTLHLASFLSVQNIAIILLAVVVLGFISGMFPGYIISKSKPIDVVKGTFRMKNRMVFSKFFIVIQNVLTIALIAAAFIITRQVEYLIHAPLGYNNKNIISVRNDVGNYNELRSLINELEDLASVKRVAVSQGTPFTRGNNNTFEFDGRNISLQILIGDSAFFNMLGFEILKDNNLADTRKKYFNEQAYKELNIKDDDITITDAAWLGNVAGKVKDFQLRNILYNAYPVLLIEMDMTEEYPWDLLIEIQGEQASAYNQVREVYEKVSGLQFEGQYMEDEIAETFAAQQRLLKIVTIFSGIAILISMLGLMAISTYFIRQRAKEIALRKINGSGNGRIIMLLVNSFLIYVVVAFLIATPVIWYVMKGWLEDYTYKISLGPLYFVAAGLFALLISLITVFFQSYRAATANPVEALKSE